MEADITSLPAGEVHINYLPHRSESSLRKAPHRAMTQPLVAYMTHVNYH